MKTMNGNLNEAKALHLGTMERIRWRSLVELLNLLPRRRVLCVSLSSPNVAQATRCRVLNDYTNIEATTRENRLYLRLAD